MMAVDSSALIAMINSEEEASVFADGLLTLLCVVGWPTALETRMVLMGRHGGLGVDLLSEWLARPNVRCLAFGEEHYREAAGAFRRYGRGSGHPARLNFGDCMAYAVAKTEDLPLLYKGSDFSQTDIRPALP